MVNIHKFVACIKNGFKSFWQSILTIAMLGSRKNKRLLMGTLCRVLLFPFVFIALWFTGGCDDDRGSGGGSTTGEPFKWVSDITPGSGAGKPPKGATSDGPWNHRVMSATSKDGLSWSPDGRIISDQASVPDAILDKDNNIRVYYVDWYNGHVISVALSHDGVDWIYKKVTIQGEIAGSREGPAPVDPDIVLLPDGRYRLYYMYDGTIYSAISNDGINFVKEEGVRYRHKTMIFDPDVIKMGDVWRMFVSLGPKNLSTVSNDGLSFRVENELPFDGSVSCTIALENGYRMYYMRQGGIHSSFSRDGRNWSYEGLRLEKAGDPTVIKLSNGTYKMFYKTWIK